MFERDVSEAIGHSLIKGALRKGHVVTRDLTYWFWFSPLFIRVNHVVGDTIFELEVSHLQSLIVFVKRKAGQDHICYWWGTFSRCRSFLDFLFCVNNCLFFSNNFGKSLDFFVFLSVAFLQSLNLNSLLTILIARNMMLVLKFCKNLILTLNNFGKIRISRLKLLS